MKDPLRRKLIEKRKHYRNAIEDSQKIVENFFKLKEIRDAEVFLLYYPHKNEVDTSHLIKKLLLDGKTVLLPKVEGKVMLPIKIEDLNSLRAGYAGIKEPSGEAFDGKIDVIVVPAVAFDEKGYRLGYGKGFYDKFLSKLEDVLKIGFAYDFQVIDRLPIDAHDIPVDIILTPTKIIKTKEETR